MAAPKHQRRTAVCTIVARNYFAQARTLFDSLAQNAQVDFDFFVLLTDHKGSAPYAIDHTFEELKLDDLSDFIPSLSRMQFQYQVVEFATAVKPSLLRYLLESRNYEQAIYFDPDILVTGSLTELIASLPRGSLTLTPHFLRGIPIDGLRPTEREVLISGCFNLGFIGVTNQKSVRAFLKWWELQLENFCVWRPDIGLFVDQRWIDLVPSFFSDLNMLRSPAYNAAFWNLHERSISQREGKFFAESEPLVFFHFSGYDPLNPSQLSRHQNRQSLTPDLKALLETYSGLLLENGYKTQRAIEYGHARFDNGIDIPDVARRLLVGLPNRDRFSNPFATQGEESFLSWMLTPAHDGAFPPLLQQIWSERPDVRSALPDPHRADRRRFWEWFERFGANEFQINDSLVRVLKVNWDSGGPIDRELREIAG